MHVLGMMISDDTDQDDERMIHVVYWQTIMNVCVKVIHQEICNIIYNYLTKIFHLLLYGTFYFKIFTGTIFLNIICN